MDDNHFDVLTRALTRSGPRRRVLGVLAAIPLLGALLAGDEFEEGLAKDRRRRRKQHHKKRNRPGKRKQSCKAKSRATICSGKCGEVKSAQTCGKTVDCGACLCEPACGDCFICDAATRSCVADPAQVGDACGGAGQVCAPDGACACTTDSCPDCKQCGADGICTGCDGCCDGESCVEDCGDCRTCDGNGQCAGCPVCCDPSGVCQAGDTNSACGLPGETCAACSGQDSCDNGACVCQPASCESQGKNCGAIGDGCGNQIACGTCDNPDPICTNNVCTGCGSADQCGEGAVCCGGECLSGICCSPSDCTDDQAPDCVGNECTCTANGNAPCSGDRACCAGGCLDVKDDPDNCGACGNACGAGKICVDGACKACDVTCSAADHVCGGTELQAAINGGGTIHVCPGIYTGEFMVGAGATVKIVGAGSTDDPSQSTILKTTDNWNLEVESATSLTLDRVHVRGTGDLYNDCLVSGISIRSSTATIRRSVLSNFGAKWCTMGILFEDSTVELIDSEITDNYTFGEGAGALVSGGRLTLRNSTIRDNITPQEGGGVYLWDGAELFLEEGSLITRNNGYGGSGVYAASGTTVTISADSAIRDNTFSHPTPQCGGEGTVVGICG